MPASRHRPLGHPSHHSREGDGHNPNHRSTFASVGGSLGRNDYAIDGPDAKGGPLDVGFGDAHCDSGCVQLGSGSVVEDDAGSAWRDQCHPRLLRPAPSTTGRTTWNVDSLDPGDRRTGRAGWSPVWRILFHSTTIYGADLAESGYVIAPGAPPPATGHPVIAWAHGTTGFAARCAPSLFTNAGGGNGPYLIPGLANYLRAGYVVTAADYQGLGVSHGVHPYLLGDSEGRSVLDATRASRHLPGLRTSDTVVVYGHSQGGHAALFAGEMAPTYAPDLHVVGVVAAAPATGLSTLISIVGTSTGQQYLPFSIPTSYASSQTYNDLPITDVFTATGEKFAREEVTKGCLDSVANAIGRRHLTPGQVFLTSSETNPIVVAHAKANDPGRVRTPYPC